jgi:hypothetical protein
LDASRFTFPAFSGREAVSFTRTFFDCREVVLDRAMRLRMPSDFDRRKALRETFS